jgi:hypothetical protein
MNVGKKEEKEQTEKKLDIKLTDRDLRKPIMLKHWVSS